MMCKFYEKCDHASNTAFTCIEGGGGNYCGRYRVLSFGYQDYSSVQEELDNASRPKEILV